MAKQSAIEQQLLELSGLRADAKSTAARERFIQVLAGKNNLLAARVATIVKETGQTDFIPALSVAFERFFSACSDKGCAAKTAIADALYTLGLADIAPLLRGIRHIQMEPTYGGQIDSAAELRGICGLGLVRSGYRDVLLELVPLLMDREPQTRQMAVRAVIYANQEPGALLLRMKILAGDENPDVIAEALAGLMKLSPAKSVEFVERFLDHADSATAESAVIAIGSWKTPAAFKLLHLHWEKHIRAETRAPLLLGMAMTRQSEAIDFLLDRIRDESPRPATDAIIAMGMYKYDEAVRGKVETTVRTRDDAGLIKAFQKAFTLP